MVVALSRGLPERFKSLRVLVVANEDRTPIDTLSRMGIANVCCVSEMAAARELCDTGDIDICLAVLPRAVPDEEPAWDAKTDAPGRGRVPSLLMVEATTPYARRSAASAGYHAVIPATVSFRMLYRCIGGLLQAGQPGRRPHTRMRRLGGVRALGGEAAISGKPKLQ
jgi:hypothetical protein